MGGSGIGRQVRFLLQDAEIALLEEHLREVGAAFIPLRSPSEELHPQADLSPPAGFLGLTPDIVRAADLPNARRVYVETPWADPPSDGYWGLDKNSILVIDYNRGSPTDAGQCGRLHFDTSTVQEGWVVPLDSSFVKWADEIVGWVQRTFRYDPAAMLYVGPPGSRRRAATG